MDTEWFRKRRENTMWKLNAGDRKWDYKTSKFDWFCPDFNMSCQDCAVSSSAVQENWSRSTQSASTHILPRTNSPASDSTRQPQEPWKCVSASQSTSTKAPKRNQPHDCQQKARKKTSWKNSKRFEIRWFATEEPSQNTLSPLEKKPLLFF